MNKFLTIIALAFINIVVGQNQLSCEKGTKRALKDFKNKKYILQTLGQSVDKDFDPVFVAYAKKKYNIQITGAPDVIFPEPECYSKAMRTRVLKKFGNHIEVKMKVEALEVFKKTNTYINEIKPKIDTGFVFYAGHTNAEYPGNETGLRAFLCNAIKETPKTYWTTYISFIVEKDGSVSNLTFTKEEPAPEVKGEVERLFLLMDKWTPATYYGEKIRVKISHSISSKKNMEMRDDIRQKQLAEWQEDLRMKKQLKQQKLQKQQPKKKSKKPVSAKKLNSAK